MLCCYHNTPTLQTRTMMKPSTFFSVLTVLSVLLTGAHGRLHRHVAAARQHQQHQQQHHKQHHKHYSNMSMCERIHPEELPEECSCHDKPPLGLVVTCLKRFNDSFVNDTIGMKIDIDPCNPNGSRVAVDLTEANHNIDMIIASVQAGEEQDFPIPGMSVIVPGLGHLGVDVAILISGNPDSLTLKIGLNACVALTQRIICASSIPGVNTVLPWWVLSGTYHFSDICEQRMAIAASGKSGDAVVAPQVAAVE